VGGASPRTQVGHLVEEKMMSGEEAEEKNASQFQGKIEVPVQRAMADSRQTGDQAHVRQGMVQAWCLE
jgi:hypothetical protein